MDTHEHLNIDDAVTTCLAECRASDRPYMSLTARIDQFTADGWTEVEITELQTRVVRRLLDHDD